MYIFDKYNLEIKELFSNIEKIRKHIKIVNPENSKILNGEIYFTNKEVCKKLKIFLRTLQGHKDSGKLLFIKISGKILFKECDVRKLVEDNYFCFKIEHK